MNKKAGDLLKLLQTMNKNKIKMMEEVDYFENIDNNAQYQSFEAAIEAHAKEYSFNIESMLFPQLTTEQQKLWRNEIEQAYISGANAGMSLARDFTKKDAFIEKACEFIKEHHHEFSFWNTEEYELEFSTQKFIEDFKAYMKGE